MVLHLFCLKGRKSLPNYIEGMLLIIAMDIGDTEVLEQSDMTKELPADSNLTSIA